MDNYVLQLQSAQKRFLTYDQDALIQKLRLLADEKYLYIPMLGKQYRLCRHTGCLERKSANWEDANTFGEVMVLLDILCDSREDRCLSGQWQSLQQFGKLFHTSLLEPKEDPLATGYDKQPGLLKQVCLSMGGRPISGGDEAYAVPLMDEMEIVIFFWHADEEFPAQFRFFWDKNALQYIRYETMHYALGLLKSRMHEQSLLFSKAVVE